MCRKTQSLSSVLLNPKVTHTSNSNNNSKNKDNKENKETNKQDQISVWLASFAAHIS